MKYRGGGLTMPDLQTQYGELNQRFFQGELPLLPVRWSDRMTRSAGIYYGSKGYIALSKPLLENNLVALRSTLLHEMIHVWCHRVKNAPQEGHGRLFQQRMAEINQSQSEIQVTIRHTLDTHSLSRYLALCTSCGRSRLYHQRNSNLACRFCCQAAGVRWSRTYALDWILMESLATPKPSL